MSHEGHDHDNTPQARAACRRGQALKAAITQVAANPQMHVERANRGTAWWMITRDSMIAPDDAEVLSQVCTGPNKECRKWHKQGRSVHVIPDSVRIRTLRREGKPVPSLVMPTYHFHTEADGREAIAMAWKNAVLIITDEDLYAARNANLPYLLFPGWIDPSRRNAADWERYRNARGLNAN